MPLTVSRFGVSLVLVLIFIFGAFAQSAAPTSADVMRERITKAKALMAVKNYNAAIYEMEGIRRETSEPTVNSVVQVMLMGCYLEQSDYKRAQGLLNELYAAQKSNKPNANYFAVAAQIVKGARNQMDRYNSLGLTVSDRNLPIDAVNDVTKMRETVETVITQSKDLSADKKQSSDAMALLEEAINARSGLATDDYDAKRWKNEVADVRENMMNSRTIVNAVDDSGAQNSNSALAQNPPANTAPIINVSNPATTPNTNSSAADNKPKTETPKIETAKTEIPKSTETPNQTTAKTEPPKTSEKPEEIKTETKKDTTPLTPNVNTASNTPDEQQQPTRNRRVQVQNTPSNQTPNVSAANKSETTAENSVKDDSPLAVGSLLEYATEKINPVYPPAARTMRMTGTVRVDLVVDEEGKVEVQNTSGPSMLQRAALDAVKRWKFKPFMRDGQPVKAKGFVSFNFNF